MALPRTDSVPRPSTRGTRRHQMTLPRVVLTDRGTHHLPALGKLFHPCPKVLADDTLRCPVGLVARRGVTTARLPGGAPTSTPRPIGFDRVMSQIGG